jgi:ATP-dependent DNA ligase
MPKYENYRYIYPPRPKNAIPDYELSSFDDGTFIAQPKLNGSNCVIFTNGTRFIAMNRHGQRLTNFELNESELKSIYRGSGWMILNGEYLNKSQSDETGKPFNHKFAIFDILCFNGEYLLGKTFEERIQLLDNLYGQRPCEKDYLFSISENVYRVKSYLKDFKMIYDRLTPIDVIEGLVMKRKNAKLEIGLTENNNTKSQLKCRKSTRNYKY